MGKPKYTGSDVSIAARFSVGPIATRHSFSEIGQKSMPHWISEKIMAIVSFIPALFVDPESANFTLIRAMFGLILIALVVYAISLVTTRRVRRR